MEVFQVLLLPKSFLNQDSTVLPCLVRFSTTQTLITHKPNSMHVPLTYVNTGTPLLKYIVTTQCSVHKEAKTNKISGTARLVGNGQ